MVRLPNGLFDVCHKAVYDVTTELSRSIEWPGGRLILFCSPPPPFFLSSVSRFGKRGTVVGGMSDQPFSTSSSAEGQSQQPGRRNRRHASWLLSVRLVTAQSPSDRAQTGAEDPPGI